MSKGKEKAPGTITLAMQCIGFHFSLNWLQDIDDNDNFILPLPPGYVAHGPPQMIEIAALPIATGTFLLIILHIFAHQLYR